MLTIFRLEACLLRFPGAVHVIIHHKDVHPLHPPLYPPLPLFPQENNTGVFLATPASYLDYFPPPPNRTVQTCLLNFFACVSD